MTLVEFYRLQCDGKCRKWLKSCDGYCDSYVDPGGPQISTCDGPHDTGGTAWHADADLYENGAELDKRRRKFGWITVDMDMRPIATQQLLTYCPECWPAAKAEWSSMFGGDIFEDGDTAVKASHVANRVEGVPDDEPLGHS